MVDPIDKTPREMLGNLYLRFVRDRMRVLYLMSSRRSHMPTGIWLKQLTGIGLNAVELQHTPALTEHIVQDLNTQIDLPHPDRIFDGILCALSVAYLTGSETIFNEVARVLAPEGGFVVSLFQSLVSPQSHPDLVLPA